MRIKYENGLPYLGLLLLLQQ